MPQQRLDLTNQQFGSLTAVYDTGTTHKRLRVWHCICDCGNSREATASSLKRGEVTACQSCMTARRQHDLSGQKFGSLLPLHTTGFDSNGSYIWQCRCDCQTITYVSTGDLNSGNISSCRDCGYASAALKRTTHGLSRSAIYRRFQAMHNRVYNPNHNYFHVYGGRGIRVCQRWHDFENFVADMANSFSPELQLERIDNDGHYEPSNCRWATPREQSNNTRSNRLISWNDETHTLTEWSRILGINPHTINARLRYGWSIERTFTEPVRSPHKET